MPQYPKVAVLGAGSSGIAAAKVLHQRGIPFVALPVAPRAERVDAPAQAA